MLPDLNKKKHHLFLSGNPANERFQMLTHLFGHEKSATHTARNVRPFYNSCPRSVAQGAPTASTRSPSASSQAHTPCAEGPRGAPGGTRQGIQTKRLSAMVLSTLQHFPM